MKRAPQIASARLAVLMTALTAALTAGLLSVQPACAHQMRESVLSITDNPRTGMWELQFRIHADDAGPALGGAVRAMAGEGPIAGFVPAYHLLSSTEISPPGGAPLALSYVGAELDRGYVWIYAQTPAQPRLQALEIRHQGESADDHRSLVSVRLGAAVLTAQIAPAETLHVSLAPSPPLR